MTVQRVKKGVLFSGTEVLKEVNLRAELTAEREDFSGIEVYFIKRDNSVNYNDLVKEDKIQTYTKSWLIRIKKKTKGGWETAGGDAIRNFTGLEFSYGETLYISKKNFHSYCGDDVFPEPGDLIWIPMAKALFEINFQDDDDVQFYAEGEKYTYAFYLHSYIYSGEVFQTDIEELNNLHDTNPASVDNNQLVKKQAKKRNVKNTDNVPKIDFGDL